MYHVAGILTRGDAPERVVGCPQGCAQAVDKVVDKYLRKKVGLTHIPAPRTLVRRTPVRINIVDNLAGYVKAL